MTLYYARFNRTLPDFGGCFVNGTTRRPRQPRTGFIRIEQNRMERLVHDAADAKQ